MAEVFEWLREQIKMIWTEVEKIFSAEVYNDDFNGQTLHNLVCYGDVCDAINEAEQKWEVTEAEIRNKAIEEFLARIEDVADFVQIPDMVSLGYSVVMMEDIYKIAEQMKEVE